ncbi:MAG TPA: hypothetical protein VFJ94_03920 [Intrasporangium sp.]|uniref:hypothetical protein n=1 Tax=Intrasporangium sp. TaxID=1925024 RepID=UPI002D77A0B6|nr:hypothetical protein [Intrasporangium sp.]HET7397650.1 hypothetical protein [Intrasporangium sp.]
MSATATRTIASMTVTTGVSVTTGHDLDVDIPVLTGMQRQGDVLVIPSPAGKNATTPVPATGTPVVRGENGGNTHAIYPDGPGVACDTFAADGASLRVATLTVPAGSTAYLGHPEHGFMGIGPGRYELRRQREMADELRVVAD